LIALTLRLSTIEPKNLQRRESRLLFGIPPIRQLAGAPFCLDMAGSMCLKAPGRNPSAHFCQVNFHAID
jgi:hypothetical protein